MKQLIILFMVLSASCCLEHRNFTGELTIMSWNLQNLFDGKDNGSEYSEFSVKDGTWSVDMYHTRLKKVVKIIELNNPDIIAFQEIEGESILDDIKNDYLKEYKYSAVSRDPGAIKTGLLSKYPISKVGIISPSTDTYSVRNLLEVHININDMELVVINNHWKSKSGGGFTENLRLESSKALKKRLIELEDEEVVILGDLNENYDEYRRVGRSYQTALMFEQEGEGLTITDSKSPDSGELFTPWPDSEFSGSYKHNDYWETIDHFLLNGRLMDSNDFYFDSFYVDIRDTLFEQDGDIKKWITDYGQGYSDHLPIVLKLKSNFIETILE